MRGARSLIGFITVYSSVMWRGREMAQGMMNREILRIAALFAGMLLAGPVLAANCVSQANGNWNSATTWTSCGGGTPGNNDNVTIASPDTVTLNVSSAQLRDVVVQAGATLIGNAGTVLTIGRTGGVNLSNSGTIDFTAGATIAHVNNAAWTGNGTYNLYAINLSNKAITFSGTVPTLISLNAPTPIVLGGAAGLLTSNVATTWNFNGTAAQTLPTGQVTWGAMTINNTSVAGVTLGTALTATNILGDLSVNSGTLNNGGFAITLAANRNFSVANGATFRMSGTTGMVTVSGAGTKTFGTTLPNCSTVEYAGAAQTVSNETYGHLTLSGSGVKTMPGTAMNVACDFSMAGSATASTLNTLSVGQDFKLSGTAQFTAGNAVTVTRDFTLNTGSTFTASTYSHSVGGDFSNTGTFNANTSTFTFNGTAAQSITGATTFNNLTLNNTDAGGIGLTLNDDVTVSSVLTFTSGKISTGANKIIIGTAGSYTGNSSARYVVGTMEKVGPVGTFTFAIGDATNYTPVLTAFSAGGATGSLAANTTAGEHPNIGTSGLDSTQDVNRYWTLTSTGLAGTYDATFNYVAGDKDGGSDATMYEVERYAGGWNATTIGTRNATDTQATGLTAFGEFAIGEVLPTVDHYLITHDGSMVTCLYEDIVFTAHNAGHTASDPAAMTDLDITTSTGRGTWVGVVAGFGNGTLSDPTPGNPNNGDVTYTFPGAESSVTLRLRYTNPATDPELVNFNVIDDNSKTEATGTGTDLVDGNDANLSVASTGFVFYNSTDSNTTIPTQIAGKHSNEGFGAKDLALRAVKASDSDPSVCATDLFLNGSTRDIELGAECRNPATCAGNVVKVTNNGTIDASITTNDDNAATLTSAYTTVSLTFGANSTAELHILYPDAGQMALHARYDLANPAGTYMTGSSNDFVVRPFGFKVTATGNPAAADQDGTVFKAADEDFTVNVSAVVWESGDDGNNDGVPDGHESGDTDPTTPVAPGITDNAVLPNFGQESGGGEDVVLTAVLYLPAGGADSGLDGGTSITSFVAGAGSTATARYAEVGIIEITAAVADSDYLGAGQVLSKSGRVGRFTPFEFTVSSIPATPTFSPGCNADTTDFTYLEQPFVYTTDPQVTITAVSKLGSTTTNYDGVWWKLSDPDLPNDKVTFTYTHDGGALPGGTTLDSAAATQEFVVDCTGGACDGAILFTLSGPLSYTRTITPVAPFNAAVDITFNNLTDGDGVTYAGNPFKFDNVVFTVGANEQRWGRLAIGEAVGDPAITLDVPVTAEYYDGAAFVTNADDDCTAFVLASDVKLSNEATGSPQDGDQPMNIGAGTTSVTSGNGLLANGQDLMTFSFPGAGNTGLVDISLDLTTLTGADLVWLYYDWDADGTFDTTATGRASFGIISGPESVIYSREPW